MSSRDLRLSQEILGSCLDNISEACSPNKILQSFIETSESFGHRNHEIYTALDILSVAENLKSIDSNSLKSFTTVLLDRLIMMLNNSFSDELAKLLLCITSKLERISSVLSIIIQEVNISAVHIMLQTGLKVIEQHYTFFEQSYKNLNMSENLVKRLNALFAKCQKIQRMFISIIMNNIQLFIYTNDRVHEDIHLLLLGLCSVGKFIALVDVKSTAAIWKCISRLSTECCDYVKAKGIQIPWMCFAVDFLCKEIHQSIIIILENSKDDDLQAFKKTERILKVNSFYLKIVTKLAAEYTYEYFEGYNSFVELCIVLNSLPENIVNSKVGQSIKQYLTVGVNTLISEIFQSSSFENALCGFKIKDSQSFYAFSCLSADIMEHLIMSSKLSDAEIYFHSKEVTIFSKILDQMYVDPLLRKDVYERLVTTTAALIISTSSFPSVLNYFELLLLQGMLSVNFLRCLLCCDIMCTIFRFANEEVRLHYLKFFLEIYFINPIFYTSPKAVFLQFLVRSLYTIISDSQKKYLVTELVNDNSKSDVLIKLALIFSDSISKEILNFPNSTFEKTKILKSRTEDFRRVPTVDSYYKLAIDLLINQMEVTDDYFIEPINNLWAESIVNEKALHNNSLNSAITRFFENHISTSNKHAYILSNVNYALLSPTSRANILKILVLHQEFATVSENRELKLLNLFPTANETLFIHLIHYMKNEILILFEGARAKPVNYELKFDYYSQLSKRLWKHLCQINSIDTNEHLNTNPSKRLKVLSGCPLLSEAKKICDDIKSYFEKEECTDEDLTHLNYIVNIFNEIRKKAINKY